MGWGKDRKARLSIVLICLMVGAIFTILPVGSMAQVTVVEWATDQTLNSDFTVANDEVLKIRAGVSVYLDPNVNITVYGNISALGQSTDPVTFSWNTVGSNWGAINIFGAREESHFYYTHIENAREGIFASSSDVQIHHSNISFSTWNGTHVTNGKAVIQDSSFFQNGLDPYWTDAAIYLNNATGQVERNAINTNNNGIFMKNHSNLTVRYNNITDTTSPMGFGIEMRSGTTSFIEQNRIYKNHFGLVSNASAPGVKNNTIEDNYDNGILSTDNDDATFQYNIIRNNGDEGIDTNTGATPLILSNNIYGNSDKGVLVWGSRPQIMYNDIHNNSVGIQVAYGGNATTFENDIHDNLGTGIMIKDDVSFVGSMLDSIWDNGGPGVHMDQARAFFHEPTIRGHYQNVQVADNASVILENGTVSDPTSCNLNMTSSTILTINTTLDKWDTQGSTSSLEVVWYLGIKVVNGRGQPFPNVNVTVKSVSDEVKAQGTTNPQGNMDWIYLTQNISYFETDTVVTISSSPYTINVSKSGFWNETIVTLDKSRNITIPLDVPNEPPTLINPISSYNFSEDTNAYSLVNLSEFFTDEGPLIYELVYEEDTTTIDGQVNGTTLDFFTPKKDWFGKHWFRVNATDEEGETTPSNNFTVEVTPVNDPPVLTPISDQTVQINEKLQLQLNALDVDDPLSDLTFRTLDKFVPEINVALDASGHVTFVSTIEGEFSINFSVCDLEPLCSENMTLNITVLGSNAPPVFLSNPPLSAHINNTYVYDVLIMDPEDDPMTLVMVYGPPGMVLDGQTLRWSPTSMDLGDHDVRLRVNDGLTSTYQDFTITVQPINHAPTARIITPLSGEIFEKGENISISGSAFDEDFDNLSYVWKIDEKVVSTDLGLSKVLDPGVHAISFSVSDGAVTVYDNITINVRAGPDPGPGAPPAPYKTSSGGDEWCLWLPILLIAMILVTVILTNRYLPDRGHDRSH